MTQTVPDQPAYGSVEDFADRLQIARGGGLYAYALGAIESAATHPGIADAERVRQIRNVITAVSQAETERSKADPAGQLYSRTDIADDPTPVSPARGGEVHVGAVTRVGLVDETPAEPVHYLDFGSDGEEDDRLACGKQVREVSQHTCNFAQVTCPVCIAAMAPVSEALR